MGIGGLIGGLGQANLAVENGGLQGKIQGNEIVNQRQMALMQYAREYELAQAQIQRDKAMSGYYGGLNDARQQIATHDLGRHAVRAIHPGHRGPVEGL